MNIVRVGNSRWEVISGEDQHRIRLSITSAMASGSVGFRECEYDPISDQYVVVAEVAEINSDGSRRLPYTNAY